MADYHITRGSELRWRMNFYDADRNPTSPPSVTLYVSYKHLGESKTDIIGMTGEAEGLFTAEWESAVADAGYVYWHVRASGASPHAVDGRIVLVANPANPKPV